MVGSLPESLPAGRQRRESGTGHIKAEANSGGAHGLAVRRRSGVQRWIMVCGEGDRCNEIIGGRALESLREGKLRGALKGMQNSQAGQRDTVPENNS